MKNISLIFLLAAALFYGDTRANTIHQPNFFDTVSYTNSLVILRVTSGESCVEKEKCWETQGKKYKVSKIRGLAGENIPFDSATSKNNLCVGCEYFATIYIKKDKSILVNILPVNIIEDAKTKERQLLYVNENNLLPVEMSNLKLERICNAKLQCKDYPIYRYISEKKMINALLIDYNQTH